MFTVGGLGWAAPVAAASATDSPDVDPFAQALLSGGDISYTVPSGSGALTLEQSGASTWSSSTSKSTGQATTQGGGTEIQYAACIGSVDNVHYSKGAGGAISKAHLTCTGTIPSVRVHLQGLITLGSTSSGPWTPRATLNIYPTIPVDGVQHTYYIPPVGSNGGTGEGWWTATITFYIDQPGVGSVGSQTKLLYTKVYPSGVS